MILCLMIIFEAGFLSYIQSTSKDIFAQVYKETLNKTGRETI